MKSSLFTTTNTKVQLGITQTFCCISYLAAGCLRGSKLFWHASHFYCWNFLVTKKKIDRIVVEKLPKTVSPLHKSISVINLFEIIAKNFKQRDEKWRHNLYIEDVHIVSKKEKVDIFYPISIVTFACKPNFLLCVVVVQCIGSCLQHHLWLRSWLSLGADCYSSSYCSAYSVYRSSA